MRHFLALLLLVLLPATGFTQGAAPDARYIATRDLDFYGADLDTQFDTDLTGCVRACDASPLCVAFTFNIRSNACFPKSRITERTPYAGALSAEKIVTPGSVLELAKTRRAALGFLTPEDIAAARQLARTLGLEVPSDGAEVNALVSGAQGRVQTGDFDQAATWMAMAVSLTDRADLWTSLSRITLRAGKQKSGAAAEAMHTRSVLAALNGYLRAASVLDQTAALDALARAFEKSGRGRDMINSLRLALRLDPTPARQLALDQAIAKYGFRIIGTTVENESEAPRICTEFSDPLNLAGTDYAPFVRLDDSTLVVQAEDRRLCIDGVTHGVGYRMTFRQGLPAADGEVLHKDVVLNQYVRDRSPAVRFEGRSYVLPRSALAAIPVETVNLTEIALQLRRISDRNLLRAIQDDFFGRPLSHWQDQQFSQDIAQDVWSGTAQVKSDLNQNMTTRLPLGEALAGQEAGIFALTARIPGADPYDDPGATQWFVLTDLGLSTVSGTDGLQVSVRGLSDARARSGISVRLISRANAVLAEAQTDADGLVRFAPGLTRGTGGAEPALVVARQGQGDLSFLALTGPAFDLSDRGVTGRPPSGPVDIFLTTDRGAYRAGETINATVLVRDASAIAIRDLPVTAILNRPDGVEYQRQVSRADAAGGHVFSFPVGPDAPRGTWRLEIKTDPRADPIASQPLLIEDFMPERIDFDLALASGPPRVGDDVAVRIDARYLFGAPGADLNIEGQTVLRHVTQLDAWPGYHFGRYDTQSNAQSIYFGGQRTDADGQAVAAITLPDPESQGAPLEMTVTARLSDGAARPVERDLTTPVQPRTPMIGIKPLFDGVIGEGGRAAFEVIGLSPDLEPMTMPIRWTLNRIETRYQWYQLYGNWNWEPTTRRTRIDTGSAELGEQPLSLSAPVEWGQYELVAERLDGLYVAAAVNFYAGWQVPADASATPDWLDLSLDRPDYAPGDTALLRVVPRVAGRLLVSVLSNRIIEQREIDVSATETVVPLPVTAAWGTGAYVTATLLRPMDVDAGQAPTRAIGLVHARIDPADKALSVSINAPDMARPRQTQQVSVKVEGARANEKVWLTLSAVDLGILNLTGFESPDPKDHYFGQRRLGVELRDAYGRLIDGLNGDLGVVRSGGDAAARLRSQTPPPTQDLMASFSGLVEIGADGNARIPITLPAFNGTVRLMAVAWSDTAVGQAERDMLVRDPVVVTATTPRFLAPGDQGRLRLDLVHADGPAGEMAFSLRSDSGALTLGQAPATVTLTEGGKTVFDVPMTAIRTSDPRLQIRLTTPDGQTLDQQITMPVRRNDPEVSQTRRFSLESGDSFAFTDDVFAGLRADTGRAVLSAGPLARFDTPGLLSLLDRYPYGCTEQVTSRSMPLLYLSSVAQATGLGNRAAIDARIEAAVAQILTRQSANGGFGLWRAGSDDFWLTAYAADFLSRAGSQGFDVPAVGFRLVLENLRNRINYAPDFDLGGEDIAYALMVLAREGQAAMGDLRYYADVKGKAFATPLAAAQIATALATYGDTARADVMFQQAARMIAGASPEAAGWRSDYGSNLRDAAAVMTLATEAGSAVLDATGIEQQVATRISAAGSRLSPQEAAWSLLAARALTRDPGQSGLRINGQDASGPFIELRQANRSQDATSITAQDGQTVDLTLTTFGIPEIAPPAGGTGYRIDRRYYTLDGEPRANTAFAVGDRFVTVITVTPFEDAQARLMLDDPLPAGIEIDNPSLLRAGDVRALDWLTLSEVQHAEFRSDRFLAAVDLRQDQPVTVAYVARAVSPGQFHHPAASVEDMYRPEYRAWTDTGRVSISR